MPAATAECASRPLLDRTLARGLSEVALVTSDAHAGLLEALGSALLGASSNGAGPTTPGTSRRGCRSRPSPGCRPCSRTVFAQFDPAEVRAQFERVVDALEAKVPKAASHLAEARDELLAFTAFPREVWRQIWPNNSQERLNKEIRRRTDVVGIFPDRDAVLRLVGAVPMEQNDEWTESRRYMGLEVLTKVRAVPASKRSGV